MTYSEDWEEERLFGSWSDSGTELSGQFSLRSDADRARLRRLNGPSPLAEKGGSTQGPSVGKASRRENVKAKISHQMSGARDLRERIRSIDAYDRTSRRLTKRMMLLGLLAIVISVLELELAWTVRNGEVDTDLLLPNLVQYLKLAVSMITIANVMYLVRYYTVRAAFERALWEGVVGAAGFGAFRRPFLWPMLAETVLLLVHAPPWLDYRVADAVTGVDRPFLSDKINLACFLRLYQAARLVRDNSGVFRTRMAFLRAKMSGPVRTRQDLAGWFFAFKVLFKREPLYIVSWLSGSMFIMFSYIIYVTEREYRPEFGLGSALWFTLVTMTTVGYGDITVVDSLSKVFAALAAVAGIILISISVSVITSQLELNGIQARAETWFIEKRDHKMKRDDAALLIQTVWRLRKSRGGSPGWLYRMPEALQWELFLRIASARAVRELHSVDIVDDSPLAQNRLKLLAEKDKRTVEKLMVKSKSKENLFQDSGEAYSQGEAAGGGARAGHRSHMMASDHARVMGRMARLEAGQARLATMLGRVLERLDRLQPPEASELDNERSSEGGGSGSDRGDDTYGNLRSPPRLKVRSKK